MSETRGTAIAVTGSKGGPGKSTISQNLACEKARQGFKVCIYDTDPQNSIINWAHRREDRPDFEDLPRITVKSMSDSLRQSVKDDTSIYDYVIIDVAGRSSRELTTALFSADIVLIPTAPTIKDTETLVNIAFELEDTADKAPDHRRAYGVINKAMSSSRADALEARAYFENEAFNGAFEPLPTMISHLKAFDNADAEGLGVVEVKKSSANKAKAQIQLICKEIDEKFAAAINETYGEPAEA